MKYTFAFLGTALISSAAIAADPYSTGPCARDAKSICSNVGIGEGRIARCLHEHQNQLSAACRDKILDRRAERLERKAERLEKKAERMEKRAERMKERAEQNQKY